MVWVKILFVVVLSFVVAMILLLVFSLKGETPSKTIDSFEECARLYPIQESYPERCSVPGGKTFTRGVLQ